MDAVTVRQPIELHMTDPYSCVVNVITQLQYVWGQTDKPNVTQTTRVIGRTPGKPMKLHEAAYYLLRQGFTLQEVRTWDEAAFVREGERYARRYFGEAYSEAIQDVNLTSLRDLTATVLRQQAPYRQRRQITTRIEQPTVKSIRALLAKGWTVIVEISTPREDVGHLGLLLPRDDYPNGSAVWLYYPRQGGTTIHPKALTSAMRDIEIESFGFMGVRLG